MGHDSQKRIVDLMCRAEGKLRERSILFILRKLPLELKLLFGQLTFFFQTAHKLLLREITFILAVVGQIIRVSQFAAGSFQAQVRAEGEANKQDDSETQAANEGSRRGH